MQINHVKKSDLPNRLECIMRWTYTYTPLYVHVETTHTKKDVSQEILLLKLSFFPARFTQVFSSLSPAELPWLGDPEDKIKHEV